MGTYSHSHPFTTGVSDWSVNLNLLKNKQQDKPGNAGTKELRGMLFEQVLSGDEVRNGRHHVYISDTATVQDTSVPQLSQITEQMQAAGFAGSDMTTAKLLAVDALYKLEPDLAKELKKFLKGTGFGPFEHVGSAVYHLLRLEEAGKKDKACRFEKLLSQFAEAHNGDMDCLRQWPELMEMTADRDAFAHPLDIALLQSMIADKNPDVQPVGKALTMLLGGPVVGEQEAS